MDVYVSTNIGPLSVHDNTSDLGLHYQSCSLFPKQTHCKGAKYETQRKPSLDPMALFLPLEHLTDVRQRTVQGTRSVRASAGCTESDIPSRSGPRMDGVREKCGCGSYEGKRVARHLYW